MRTHTHTLKDLLGLLVCAVMVQSLSGCTIQSTGSRIQINANTFTVNGITVGNRAQEVVQQRVAAEQIAKLDIDTAAGNIEIRPNNDSNEGSANTILIRATKYVTGNRPVAKLKTYLSTVKVTQRLQGDTLVVRSEAPDGALPNGVGYYVSYLVTVPKRMALELKTISGNIAVDAAQEGVRANSSSGSIALRAVGGPLDLQTVSGDIGITDAPDASSVTAATSSGDMELKNIAGRLTAHSVSGDITVQGAKIRDSFTAESSSGALKFTAVRAAGSDLDLNLTTISGDIDYEGDLSKIDAHTSSGSIEIGGTTFLDLREAKVESISGNLSLKLPGLKSAQIRAHTVSGSLDLPEPGPDLDRDTAEPGPPLDSDTSDEGEDKHTATLVLGNGTTPVTPVTLNTSSGDIALSTER